MGGRESINIFLLGKVHLSFLISKNILVIKQIFVTSVAKWNEFD